MNGYSIFLRSVELKHHYQLLDQAAGDIEYTDCTSANDYPPECPGDNTKQSDGEVPVMPEFWEKQSTPSLPSHPGPNKNYTYTKLNCLK